VLQSEIPHLAMIGVITFLLFGLSVLFLVHLRQRHRQMKGLEKLNEELDDRVRERTAELEAGNNALRESEERFRRASELLEAVTKGTNVIIAALDLDLRYTFFNTAYAAEIKRLTGKEILIGASMADLFSDQADQLAVAEREWREVLAGNTTNRRLEFGDPGRHRRVYSVLHTPLRDTDDLIVGAGEVAYDITDQVEAEEMLKRRTLELQRLTETLEARVEERTAELADLSSKLVSAQEEERKRVSYDLHDNVWQTLLAIRSEIERLLSDRSTKDHAALQDKSKKVLTAILDMVGKIRSMQGDLWPYVLDDIGILATLDWYCREFEKKHSGLTIDSHTEFGEGEVLSPVKIVIYRILQEALSNVAKHSRASQVTLRLMKKDHGIEFSVEDNGIGFDPEEAIAKRAPWGGLGLLSIKARTELSGGSFAVESAKGKGTTVRATWPL
jgi:signal transduction histidine kinase